MFGRFGPSNLIKIILQVFSSSLRFGLIKDISYWIKVSSNICRVAVTFVFHKNLTQLFRYQRKFRFQNGWYGNFLLVSDIVSLFCIFLPWFSYILSVCSDASGERREGLFGAEWRNSSEYGSRNGLQRLREHANHLVFCCFLSTKEDIRTVFDVNIGFCNLKFSSYFVV